MLRDDEADESEDEAAPLMQDDAALLMEAGDVVLLDSYSVLHGRQTFRGARQHGVQWLSDGAGGGSGVDQGGDAGGGGASLLSGLVNQLAVKRPGRSASGGEG